MIAITGASGQLGRLVAEELKQRGHAEKISLGTRDPAKLQSLADAGFRVVAADFDRPETLASLFAGSEIALVICGNAPNDVRVRQHRAAIAAAKSVGVQRLVYTSFVNPHDDSLFSFAKVHAATERDMLSSGLSCTFLRSNQYFENLNAALKIALETGVLSMPGVSGKVAYLARSDIAAAAASVLTDRRHAEQAYELTGPEALDLFEVARCAAASWARGVSACDMPVDDYRKLLMARGLPAYAVEGQVGIRLAAAAGEQAKITDDAHRLVGKPLQTMDGYLGRIRSVGGDPRPT
ncbi:MAG: NmrA family NAD(P)-binding protein [Rhizobiales bacterium]|nr:NmrA family NAD(P)-binding protein [Hyphomicrobiales bacterium]OJY46449.1 MAG: hypothetical protein BGP08_15430 [Rhizobiales bacterium 64-17]